MFAEFEKIIHALEESGEALTLEVFKSEYRKLLEIYFGPGIVLDPELDLAGLRIPHFYNAFYVYKYATGVSAAIALSERCSRACGCDRGLSWFSQIRRRKIPLETLRTAGSI
jgi:oligoendopeptidase F